MSKKKHHDGFHCATCGQFHDQLPLEFGANAPAMYDMIAIDQRPSRCELTDDLCAIDDSFFFIRGCIEIPIIDHDDPFVWGVWTSLSMESMKRCHEIWDQPGRESEPPFFGWLSTSLPLYPETINLKTHVQTRPVGKRPCIDLEPTDHPLSLEQRNGITMDRVRAIAETLLHS